MTVTGGGERTDGLRPIRILVAALVGVFVTSFPAVILVASLPDVAAGLGTDEATVAWVITAPILIAAVALPLLGRLGDAHGHRRVFLIGLAVSVGAAALCAFAWDVTSLVVLRSISQSAGGATHPTAIAILMGAYQGQARSRALGYWAFIGASSPSLGLVFGGPLVGATSWRAIFIVQVVTGLVGLVVAARWLTETERRRTASLDAAGGITLMFSVGAFLLLLDRGPTWGWASAGIVLSALVSVTATVLFVVIETRSRAPMLPLPLLRRRNFALPIITEALSQASNMGVFFIIPFILHREFDQNAAGTAFLMLPLPIGMAAASPLGGRLSWRWGSRWTAVAGNLQLIVATSGILFAERHHDLAVFLISLVVLGAGNGFLRPAAATAMTTALDGSTAGVGMATLRMISQVGTTLGITIAVATAGEEGTGGALWAAIGIGVLALAVSSRLEGRAHPPGTATAEVGEAWGPAAGPAGPG